MRKSSLCALLTAILAAPSLLFADFSYQETTQVTGGSMLAMMKTAAAFSATARQVNQPVVSNVYLKGNRMARVSPQSIEIIDLDKGTITRIDPVKHTYTVVTFEEMSESLAQAQQDLAKKQAQAPGPASDPGSGPNNVQVSFDVHLRKTGVQKQVSGLDTSEAVLTLVMNATDTQTSQNAQMGITNDMWLATGIPGYGEVRDFYKRMGEKMGEGFQGGGAGSGANMGQMLNGQAGAKEALASLAKEMREMQGVPILQVMRVGMTTNGQPLPAASEAPLPADSGPPTPSAGDVAKQGAASAITSHLGLGGFGGFGHKKQDQAPADQPASNNQTPNQTPPPGSAVLIESTIESSGFSSAFVDEVHFQVPDGYQQVGAGTPNGGRQ